MSEQVAPRCGNILEVFIGSEVDCRLSPGHKTKHEYVAKNGDEQSYVVKWYMEGSEDALYQHDRRPVCPQCGTQSTTVRGKYPGDEPRLVCPHCTQELVDDLLAEKHSAAGKVSE